MENNQHINAEFDIADDPNYNQLVTTKLNETVHMNRECDYDEYKLSYKVRIDKHEDLDNMYLPLWINMNMFNDILFRYGRYSTYPFTFVTNLGFRDTHIDADEENLSYLSYRLHSCFFPRYSYALTYCVSMTKFIIKDKTYYVGPGIILNDKFIPICVILYKLTLDMDLAYLANIKVYLNTTREKFKQESPVIQEFLLAYKNVFKESGIIFSDDLGISSLFAFTHGKSNTNIHTLADVKQKFKDLCPKIQDFLKNS